MHIAMVEDSLMDAARLQEVINEYTKEHNIDCDISSFDTGEKFLQSFAAGAYDLIFLDNYIGTLMGMEIAEEVRKTDSDVAIVFVTMSPDFAVEGFAVQALHYIIKPVNGTEMEQVFSRLGKLRPAQSPTIELLIERQKTLVKISDVIYMEVFQKACNIHMRDGVYKTYQTIDQMEEFVKEFEFIRPHRSYLVNMRYIDRIEEDQFVMTTGERVPIRHNGRSEVRRMYMHFLLKRG